MLGYALFLSENSVPEVFELTHYLADNILLKICLVVVKDKREQYKIYSDDK